MTVPPQNNSSTELILPEKELLVKRMAHYNYICEHRSLDGSSWRNCQYGYEFAETKALLSLRKQVTWVSGTLAGLSDRQKVGQLFCVLGNAETTDGLTDLSCTEAFARVCAAEGRSVGVSLTFSPVVDIDVNFRNPITNVRTFGGDPNRVLDNARAYVRTMAWPPPANISPATAWISGISTCTLEQNGFQVERYNPVADDLHGTRNLPGDRLTLILCNLPAARPPSLLR